MNPDAEYIDVTPFGATEPVYLPTYSQGDLDRALRRADAAAARYAYIAGYGTLAEFEAALDRAWANEG